MSQFEAYLFLLTDSLYSSLVISPTLELALSVMKALGTYDVRMMFITSLAGSTLAGIINYLAGVVGYNLYRFSTDQQIQLRYQKAVTIFNKYGPYILLFVVIPYFGKFTILAAGFTRFRLMRVLLYTTVSRTLYYLYVL